MAGQARAAGPDTVVVAQGADAYTMDPGRHSVVPTANALFHIYDSLVTPDDVVRFRHQMGFDALGATSWTWLSRGRSAHSTRAGSCARTRA